jgi:hypothetical protein
MFPNLETLVITKFVEIFLCNFESLLRHLPALREIVIDSKHIDSTTRIMSVIKELGINLKFVKLENFKLQSDEASLKVFFEGKFPVIEKKDGNLILMKEEKSFLKNILD